MAETYQERYYKENSEAIKARSAARYERLKKDPAFLKKKAESGRLWRLNNRKAHLEKNRSWNQSKNGVARKAGLYKTPPYKFSSYKMDAKRRGLQFALSMPEFMSFWKKPCHYCGSVVETVGLDRVENSIGYIFSNIVSCCFECNKWKGKLSQWSFLEKCLHIARRAGLTHG